MKTQERSGEKIDQIDGEEHVHAGGPIDPAASESTGEGVGQMGDAPRPPEIAQPEAVREETCQHQRSDEPTDLQSRQRRGGNGCTPLSLEELRARLKAEHRRGPDRPLYALARAEVALEAQSRALETLAAKPQKRVPDKKLLVHQIMLSTNPSNLPMVEKPEMRREAIALYSALQPEDATDSIFVRLMVAMTNNVMECHARLAERRDPNVADLYFRHAVKGTMAIIELSEARERRRCPKQIMVGQVNVEAGGQAIVGNVETPQRRRPKK